jgi:hypothetical protein
VARPLRKLLQSDLATFSTAASQSQSYSSWLGYTLSIGQTDSIGTATGYSSSMVRKRTLGSARAQVLGGLFLHQVTQPSFLLVVCVIIIPCQSTVPCTVTVPSVCHVPM